MDYGIDMISCSAYVEIFCTGKMTFLDVRLVLLIQPEAIEN